MADLAPCPFCGSADVELIDIWAGGQDHSHDFFVLCKGCKAKGPTFSDYSVDFIMKAIASWNARQATALKRLQND